MKKKMWFTLKNVVFGGLLLFLPDKTDGQIINPTLPQQFVTNIPFCATYQDDACVNADMLTVPGNVQPLKAMVWDLGSQGTSGACLGNVYLQVEDYNGNMVNVSFPGAHPDVVLGDDPTALGSNYYAAVAFVNNSYRQVINYYHITNVGTPAITLTYVAQQPLDINIEFPLYDTRAYPHLDIIPSAGGGPGGLQRMVNFIVTYCVDNGLSQSVYYRTGDVTGTPLSTNIFIGSGEGPDVAGQRDYYTNTELGYVVYHDGTNLNLATIDLTGGGTIGISNLDNTASGYIFPRIEALNYIHSLQRLAPWQVISCSATPGYPGISAWGYNAPTGATYLSPIFNGNVLSPTVAAGAGPVKGNFIGNHQYTVGFFPWGVTDNIFARAIPASTGVVNPPYYRVNNTTVYNDTTYAEKDASKSFALTNCSNSGQYIFSVWFNGDVTLFSKLSPINTMQFKPADVDEVNNTTAEITLYPNPAPETLHISQSGTYKIYDMQGRLVKTGKNDPAKDIDISNLAKGVYQLTIVTPQNKNLHQRFIKN